MRGGAVRPLAALVALAPAAAAAQLPGGGWGAEALAAFAPAAQRDRALSPLRFGGAGAGAEAAAYARRGRVRLGLRGAYARATLRPDAPGAGGVDRTQDALSAQFTALAPLGAWRGVRLLAGAAAEGQLYQNTDDVTLPSFGGGNRVRANMAALALRPVVQFEGGAGRTTLAYAVAPALAGWVWRQDALGVGAARGAAAGPAGLGAVQHAVRVARALGPRLSASAGYRVATWRTGARAGDAGPAFAALDQRLTLGVSLRARGAAP